MPAGSSNQIIDPEWLPNCAKDIQAVYRYWKGKAGVRKMPARADIDPVDLAPYLSSMLLVDVVPRDNRQEGHTYIYRLVGTREVEMRGHDPTGKPVAGNSLGHDPEAALRNYRAVVATKEPLLDHTEQLEVYHSLADLDAIFLPLSSDGVNVDMVLVYTTMN